MALFRLDDSTVISGLEEVAFDLRMLKHFLRNDKKADKAEIEAIGSELIAEIEDLRDRYAKFKVDGPAEKIKLTAEGSFGSVDVTEEDLFLVKAFQLGAKLKKEIDDTETKYYGPRRFYI